MSKVRRDKGTGTLINMPTGYYAKWVGLDGKPHKKALGTHDKRKAQAMLEEITAPLRGGNAQQKAARIRAELQAYEMQGAGKERVRVEDFSAKFVENPVCFGKSKSTVQKYRYATDMFSRWLKGSFAGVKYLDQLTEQHATAYQVWLRQKTDSTYYNQALGNVRLGLKVLVGEHNAFAKVKMVKAIAKYERQEFTKEELRIMFDAVKGDRDLDILFALALYTGARMSDCALMRRDNIDFDKGIINYTALKTKAHCELYANPALLATLKKWGVDNIPAGEYISPLNAKQYRHKYLDVRVDRVLRDCGIKTDGQKYTKTPHSFRHTFVSMCANAGVPLSTVQTMLGHADERMTRKYYHSRLDNTKNAVLAISI